MVANTRLTSKNVFVVAVSVTQNDATRILQNSHVHAVFCAFHMLRLIRCPIHAGRERLEGRPRTPAPHPFATLTASRPIVEITSPVAFLPTQLIYFLKIIHLTLTAASEIAQTFLLISRGNYDWVHPQTATHLRILRPSCLS